MAVELEALGTSNYLDADDDEEHYEFLHGQKIKKESVGRKKHSLLGKVIERMLAPLAHAQKSFIATEWTIMHGKEKAVPNVTVSFPDWTEQDGYLVAPAFLVVESISPGQRLPKLFAKCFNTYHPWGTPYCWIIDPEDGAYEVHRDYDGLVRPVTTLTAGQNISLELSMIIAELGRELRPF
ncbi:MAG: Uma2 family endonuclease [Acidobacteriaceae bacterium]|nr:Uma2 family endonuclease [Acidobacteriaceae bacterium]MBV9308710.1 Uma2 family endonuclease [Acidobacteriaceae bacterium]